MNTKCVLTRRLRACSSEVLGVIAVLAGVPLAAQSSAPPSRPVPVGDTSIFAPLMLPTANAFRTGSGAPGAAYWQNRADYATAATLDTAAMRVSGTMTLTYTNNSPDTLRYLWLQTEQNAFRTNSANSLIFPHDSRFGARGFNGGFTFFTVEQLQSKTKAQAARRSALTYRDNETMMKVDLAAALAPDRLAIIHLV